MIVVRGQRCVLLAVELVPPLNQASLPRLARSRYWHRMLPASLLEKVILLPGGDTFLTMLLIRYHVASSSCSDNLLSLI